MWSFASARRTCLRRFQVSLVPPDVEALALPLPFAPFAALALLLLATAGVSAAAEMPSPLMLLLRSGCALADRSKLDEPAAAVAPMVFVRNMELASVGEVGAVYEPLDVIWLRFMVDDEDAEGVLPSGADDDPTSGSLKAEARGVRGTGEG